MLDSNDLVLCCGTVARAGFRELVESASAAGFRGVSVQAHLYFDAREAGLSDADLRHLLDDNDVEIAELDALLLWAPGSPDPSAFAGTLLGRTLEEFMTVHDAIGGRSLNVAQGIGRELDLEAAGGVLAEIAQAVAARDMLVSIEAMPWTGIADPIVALELADRTGEPNVGLMVDSWHLFRGTKRLPDLAAIPGERIVGVQLDDAPATPHDDVLHETLHERLLPGEGDLDLEGFVRALDRMGSTAPIGVEIYSDRLAVRDASGVAADAARTTRAVLAQARGRA